MFLDGYLLAMGPLRLGDDTVLKIFPRYLTDIAHTWYLKNKISRISTIKGLADAFEERFGMYTRTLRPKKKLRHVIQGDNETF